MAETAFSLWSGGLGTSLGLRASRESELNWPASTWRLTGVPAITAVESSLGVSVASFSRGWVSGSWCGGSLAVGSSGPVNLFFSCRLFLPGGPIFKDIVTTGSFGVSPSSSGADSSISSDAFRFLSEVAEVGFR